jgi:hypothetical protein
MVPTHLPRASDNARAWVQGRSRVDRCGTCMHRLHCFGDEPWAAAGPRRLAALGAGGGRAAQVLAPSANQCAPESTWHAGQTLSGHGGIHPPGRRAWQSGLAWRTGSLPTAGRAAHLSGYRGGPRGQSRGPERGRRTRGQIAPKQGVTGPAFSRAWVQAGRCLRGWLPCLLRSVSLALQAPVPS